MYTLDLQNIQISHFPLLIIMRQLISVWRGGEQGHRGKHLIVLPNLCLPPSGQYELH